MFKKLEMYNNFLFNNKSNVNIKQVTIIYEGCPESILHFRVKESKSARENCLYLIESAIKILFLYIITIPFNFYTNSNTYQSSKQASKFHYHKIQPPLP